MNNNKYYVVRSIKSGKFLSPRKGLVLEDDFNPFSHLFKNFQSAETNRKAYAFPNDPLEVEAVEIQSFHFCTHPDHSDEIPCEDRAVGCSKHCKCCMGEFAIPL